MPINMANDPFNERYKILEKIGEGSYSEVLKCKKRDSGDIFACKRLKHNYRGWSEVNEIAEIKSLRTLARHPNILQMTEVHFDPGMGRVSLVFELMDKNLYELIKDRKRLLAEGRVRVMMFQLMRALRHLHKHGIFHRDVKPENILLRMSPTDLKLGDLGSVRGLYSKPPYTEYISTRWYRSPECLLTAGHYGFKMDIWAAGCVFYEILTLRPLFPGSSELDQINRIHNILGPPPPRILQKFCNHSEYSVNSTKKARLETIKKVLSSVSESKSRNFDWYFAPNKDPTGIDRLLPSHISVDARDLLRSLLQYDPDSRPSSHRVLQHHYFSDLREKATIMAKEVGTDDGIRPIVTIAGDARATAQAMTDLGRIDLGKIGDHKMKMKMRRLEEKKLAPIKPDHPQAGLNKLGIGTIDPTTTSSRRDENKSSIPKKTIATESALKPKKPIILTSHTLNNENLLESNRIPSLKYKYPPIEKLHVDSKGRDADVDTPGSSTTTNPTSQPSQPKPSIPEPKPKRTIGGPGQLTSRCGATLEQKASVVPVSQSTSKTKETEFQRSFVDKTKMSSSRLRRINENRAIVQLEPIGGTDIKRSVLSSDLPPVPYLPRTLAKATKEVATVKQIQTQLQAMRSQRAAVAAPTNPEHLMIPRPKKLEKNLQPVKYPTQSISDTRPIPGNQLNSSEIPRRRSNVGNTHSKMAAAELNQYYSIGKGTLNSTVPIKSEIPVLPKINAAQTSHRSWVDKAVANTNRNELMVGKLPVSKKQYPAVQPSHYDDEPSTYESPYYTSKLNAETSIKNQHIRSNNFEGQRIAQAQRRRRSDLTFTEQVPSSTFHVQNHELENVGRSVNVKALLAQQHQQRRLLEEQRVAAGADQPNSYRGNNGPYSIGVKKEEGDELAHRHPSYLSKEAKLLQMANAYQKQRVNGPTGDQPQSFATTLADREKARQLGGPARKINPTLNERSQHKLPSHVLDETNTSPRPPIGPKRLKPTVQRGMVDNKPAAQLLNQADLYRRQGISQNTNQNRKLGNPRSNQTIELEQLQLSREMANAKLRAARNDDVFFSSDDDAVTLMRQKAKEVIRERAVERRHLLDTQKHQLHQESDEDPQNLQLPIPHPPGKRLRKEQRHRDAQEPSQVQASMAGSWNTGQLRDETDELNYQADTHPSYSPYQNDRMTQAKTFYNAGQSIPPQLRSRIPMAKAQAQQQRGQMYTPPGNKPMYLSPGRLGAIQNISLAHGRSNMQHNNNVLGSSIPNRSVYKDKAMRRRGPE